MKLAFISLVSVLNVMSCGGASNGKGSQAAPGPEDDSSKQLSAADEQVVAQEFKSIPDAVIIRVPLNADGTEDEANASMRTYSGAPIENNDAALNAYTSLAQDVGSVVENELDSDSSTSSWQSFRPGNGHGGYPGSSNQTQYYNNSESTSLNVNYAGFGQRLNLQYQNTQSTTAFQSNSRNGGFGGGYGGGVGHGGGGFGGGNCGGGNCGGGYGGGNFYSNYRPFYHSGIGRSYGWHYNQARRWVAGNCNYYVYPRY